MTTRSPWPRAAFGVLALAAVIAGVVFARAVKSPPARSAGAPPPAPTPAPAEPVAPASPAPESTPPGAPATPPGDDEVDAGASSRWYEILSDGRKAGWQHVVWSPARWKDVDVVRDVTTSHTSETRDMAGTQDVFESTSRATTERGVDGLLYHTTARSEERGGRVTTSEITWTGDGYDSVDHVEGTAVDTTEERHRVDTKEPAHVDAEAMLSAKVAAGALHVGDRFVRRQLNFLARRVDERPVVVEAEEEIATTAGRVRTWRILETDPKDGGELRLWLDHDGAFVRLKQLATELRRVPTRFAAQQPSGEGASFSITARGSPSLPRIFSAERFVVDVGIAPDADRPRPEFPDSPWSRTLSVKGDAASGFSVRMELRAHDDAGAHATIPVKDPAFSKYLEPTALMPCRHPDVKGAAERAVAGESDARAAARRIADFVYTLEKESGEVGQASALEILRDRKGDCNEHALLFVALCRAVGIPARQCSGFVCIGDLWGAHAWAEIWVGAWIGVDPTTDDVGTAARYVFYGYDDDGDSRAGTVSARARGRLSFQGVSLDEGSDHVDLGTADLLARFDATTHSAVDRLAGVEWRDLPAGWTVKFRGAGVAVMESGAGDVISLRVVADQGQRDVNLLRRMIGGRVGTFAGVPAVVSKETFGRWYHVPSRKRILMLRFGTGGTPVGELVAVLEKALAPTFAVPAPAPK